MAATTEPRPTQQKTRIRDWKGLLQDESRRTRMTVLIIILIFSSSMTFMQFGFIGVGRQGSYIGYILALLGPISIAALLLGRLWGMLTGFACGLVLWAHALVQPLDLFERYFVTPANSMGLYTLAGLTLGILFSISLRNNPTGARRVVYVAISCLIASALASTVFTINTLVHAIFAVMASTDLMGDLPHDLVLGMEAMGSLTVQMFGDFATMLALCLFSDWEVARQFDQRNHASVLRIFRARLLIAATLVYLVVQSGAYIAITRNLVNSAHQKMDSEIDFIGQQLISRERFFENAIDAPEFGSLSSQTIANILDGASLEQLIAGYDLATDGTVVVFADDIILYSDSPAYPVTKMDTDVFGDENGELLEELSATGEMRSMIYNTRPPETLIGTTKTEGVYSNLELGYMRVKFFESTGHHVMMAMPSSLVFEERSITMTWASLLAFILLFAVYQLAARLLRHEMVDPMARTNESLAKITQGELDTTVTEVGSVEFAMLSAGINTTVDALKELITEADRRNERDLATAKTIQESALPRTFPPFPEIDDFDIYASMNAAKEVGGDFYDFFLVDEHTLAFLIADVSGKGIPGALFMMAAKTEIENYLATGMPPAEAIASANARLCANNDAGMFVTVWAATLDWETGLLTYVNAGHNFPLLRHGRSGSWEWLTKKCGLFLGTFETAKYRQETLYLEPGDELLLYTDGVNEAFNVDEQEYGNDRLEAFLMAHNDLRAQDMVQELRADVAHWAEGAEQSDDVTILALEYGSSSEASGSITIPATLDRLTELTRMIEDTLAKRYCPQSIVHKIDVAFEELYVNVCHYAYADQDEPGEVTISFTYTPNPSTVTIELRDQGVPFDPVTREDPTLPSNVQEAKIGGLGIFMVKKTMDLLDYRYEDGMNITTFKKSW